MANGDRIELLTAGTFESAMSTVAQESSVQACSAKIDNVDADIAALVPTITNINNTAGNINSIVSADYQLLVDLYNNKIGTTNNTGGTAAAGTVMAKLNALINGVNNLAANSNNSLYSTIFVPSETNLLKTVLNTPVQVTGAYMVVGNFVPQYTGAVTIRVTGYSVSSATSNYGRFLICPNITGCYPTMPNTETTSGSVSNITSAGTVFNSLTPVTQTVICPVYKGDVIYFVVHGYASNTCICSNISVYGTTMSYY